VSRYPKSEIPAVRYLNKDGIPIYLITRNSVGDQFFLYEIVGKDDYKKLGKSKSPVELEEKYKITEKMF